MADTNCPNECWNGWVECAAEDAEAMMDRPDGKKVDVMPCPHCHNYNPGRNVGYREDFHADV